MTTTRASHHESFIWRSFSQPDFDHRKRVVSNPIKCHPGSLEAYFDMPSICRGSFSPRYCYCCYGTCRFWRQGWNEPVCMWKPGKISILKAIWKNVWTFVKKSHFQKKNTTHQNPKNKTQKATRHEVSIIKPQKEEVWQTLWMTNVWKIWAVPVKFPILERKQELRKK